MRLAEQPIELSKVSALLSDELGIPYETAREFFTHLISLGVLITEARIPLTVLPEGPFFRMSARAGDDVLRTSAAELAATIRRCYTPQTVLEAVRSSREIATRLVPQATDALQVDLLDDVSGTIGGDVLDPIARVFPDLWRISEPRQSNAALAKQFVEKYNSGRLVPLLDLLDPIEGLSLDTTSANPKSLRQLAVTNIASRAIALGLDTVALSPEDLKQLRTKAQRADLAHEYDAHVRCLGRLESGAIIPLVEAFTAGRASSMARFSFEVGDVDWWSATLDGDAVHAELTYLPQSRRAGNVGTRRNPYPFEIPVGLFSSREAEWTLRLDDVLVGEDNGMLYCWSRRLDRRLRIHQTHVLNVKKSHLAALVEAIEAPPLAVLSFSWGSASDLPYLPAITLHGVLVRNAAWTLPVALITPTDLRSKITIWRARWNVPRSVFLVENDNKLYLDLDHDVALDELRRAATRSGGAPLRFEVATPGPADGVILRPAGGSRVANVVVPVLIGKPGRIDRVAPIYVDVARDATRPPGSDWSYFRVPLVGPRATRYLVNRVLPALRDMLLPDDDWHFVNYADPNAHLRVRVRVAEARTRNVASAIVDLLRSDVAAGTLRGFGLETYDREIERYGGPRALELAERIFTLDSDIVVQELLQEYDEAEQLSHHVQSVVAFGRSLFGSAAEAADAMSDGPRLVLSASQRLVVRKATTGDWPADGYSRLRIVAQALQTHTLRDYKNVARALLHMHCNRLGLNREAELEVVTMTRAVMLSTKHRRDSPTGPG
jgi:thiopeptide-type bacteriocin biosynthesis protein